MLYVEICESPGNQRLQELKELIIRRVTKSNLIKASLHFNAPDCCLIDFQNYIKNVKSKKQLCDSLTSYYRIWKYSLLRRRFYESIKEYEKVRNKYPSDITPEERNRLSDELGRQRIMGSTGELLHTGINQTGFEVQLSGQDLKTMIELNKYIITTASTNFPGEEGYFVVFYTTPEVSEEILNFIASLGRTYGAVYHDYSGFRGYVNMTVDDSNEVLSDTSFFANDFNEHEADLQEFVKENLVEMYVEDRDRNRRSLYSILLDFLKTLPPGYFSID